MPLHRIICPCILVTFFVTGAPFGLLTSLAQESADVNSIDHMIESLDDPDPSIRQQAVQRLREAGSAARPALVAASRSNHPGRAAQASQLLLSIPWGDPNDPAPVQAALRTYGGHDVPRRIERVSQIATDFPRNLANQILLRLLTEDPSEDVCWHVAATLRRQIDSTTLQKVRDMNRPQTRASMLTMMGRAWLAVDEARALELFRRAVEIESQQPTYDGAELDVAFDVLSSAAVRQKRFDEAAGWRRMQSLRIGVTRDRYPAPVYELFALHARYGPLHDFTDDLQTYSSYLGHPQVLYAIGIMYDRLHEKLTSSVYVRTAAMASLTAESRILVARFLHQHGWFDHAQRELSAVLSADGSPTTPEKINAHLYLAANAAARDDSLLAAEHFAAAMDALLAVGQKVHRTDADGRTSEFDPANLRWDIEWHRFRAARKSGDDSTMKQHADELVKLQPVRTDIVLDVVPYLKSTGRDDEARAVFGAAYKALRGQLDANPNDPNLMNELAWMCARSGERIDEAVKLSSRAVSMSPQNAAFLDTAAEAQFQAGNLDEAIRLEELALKLAPEDAFMIEQLERFREAKASQ